jgi:hypothetical protein
VRLQGSHCCSCKRSWPGHNNRNRKALYCIVLGVDVFGKREVIFVRGSFLKFSEKDSNCHWAFVQKVHYVKIQSKDLLKLRRFEIGILDLILPIKRSQAISTLLEIICSYKSPNSRSNFHLVCRCSGVPAISGHWFCGPTTLFGNW